MSKGAEFARMPQLPSWLIAESRQIQVDRGELILRGGDRPRYIFFVRSGMIMIFNVLENGQESKIVMVPKGGIVGEMEAIASTERIIYSARAFEKSELLRVPLASFLRWVDEDIQACRDLTRVLAEKLCAASRQSCQYTSSNAMQRLALQLQQIGVGRVGFTRQELAEVCSVSLRTINRCVKRLREEGLISLTHGKIEISQGQLEALEEWIDSEI